MVAVDFQIAPIVSKLFEWHATGEYALKEVVKKARSAGLAYKKIGVPVPTSTVHSILRNRVYAGWFEWNGKLYEGKHEPLVSVELWGVAGRDGRPQRQQAPAHDARFRLHRKPRHFLRDVL